MNSTEWSLVRGSGVEAMVDIACVLLWNYCFLIKASYIELSNTLLIHGRDNTGKSIRILLNGAFEGQYRRNHDQVCQHPERSDHEV